MSITENLLKNFSRYTLIGIVFYFLSVGINGLLIDVLGLPTLLTSLLVLTALFLVKFVVSVYLDVVKNRFTLYLVSNAVISLAAPFGVWHAVEQWGLSASISTAVILAVVFLLRYLVMGKIGLLNIENR